MFQAQNRETINST